VPKHHGGKRHGQLSVRLQRTKVIFITATRGEMVFNLSSKISASKEGGMRTLLHFRTHDSGYFHSHPLHSVFSLIASLALSVLIVLVLVSSAR
jgi:hypothetical protein